MKHLRHLAPALLAAGLSACTALAATTPTATLAPTATSTIVPSPTVVPSPTPPGCLTEPGSVTHGELGGGKPTQEFLIYLPPCYEQEPDERYPVLYLLHGQTYQSDQWVNLGAVVAADDMIHRGEAAPFIIVFPDDRYWNLPPGDGFGDRLIHDIIPHVDRTYRTLADREHRALGGLSRGGGWAIRFALTRHDLFGMVGLHSPVIFNEDGAVLERLIPAVPDDSWPRLWLDAGDRDGDLGTIRRFEALLTMYAVPHEWHLNAGDHTNSYWQAHVMQYLQWYAEGFSPTAQPEIEATPTP
jgi:enterochelin esterase-like enzyme